MKKGAAVAAILLLGSCYVFAAPNGGAKKSELNADTVEYDMNTGEMVAEGNVVLKHDGGTARGKHARYNTKTSKGILTGGVVADKDDMHMTCDYVEVLSETQVVAIGNVHGTQKKDKRTVTGPRIEYTTDTGYVRMPSGGTVTNADGSFTADFMEAWANEEHARGRGHAHIVSPPKDFEGGGETAEYFGKENGKLVLTGDAWALQENNMMRGNRLTVYLEHEGKADEAKSQ